jgi:L-threonylcarbamoyladenylate synthase
MIRQQEDFSRGINEAAEILRTGGLVAFPTETVYGLGSDATSSRAVARLFEAKGRPVRNPVIVHVASILAAQECTSVWTDDAELLARTFWPGPLTIVMPRSAKIVDEVCAKGPTVGLRIPAHPVALALLRETHCPIAAPSANRSETISPTTADHVLRTLDGRIDLVLDAGPTSGGIESTVVDLASSPPRLLRPGLISLSQLQAVLPEITTSKAADMIPRSPGQFPRHYAPSCPLVITRNALNHAREMVATERGIGLITMEQPTQVISEQVCLRVLSRDPTEYARQMYAALHDMERLGVSQIIVEDPPDTDEWTAIRDRLTRAAVPEN